MQVIKIAAFLCFNIFNIMLLNLQHQGPGAAAIQFQHCSGFSDQR
jgi:hypothetical protein